MLIRCLNWICNGFFFLNINYFIKKFKQHKRLRKSEENNHQEIEYEYKKTKSFQNITEVLLKEAGEEQNNMMFYGYLVFFFNN